MNFKKISIIFILLSTFITILNAKKTQYLIATASTGGTYYPVGIGIATIASLNLSKKYKIIFSAITSAGSAQNIDMINKKEVDFAILQGLFASMAWQGIGKYKNKAKKNLRSISTLWQNVEQFVVYKKYAKTGNIKDIKNLYNNNFSIGKINSGTRVSGETILSSLKIAPKKMNLKFVGYGASSKLLQNKEIEGMNIPAGTPTSAVTNAFLKIGANNLKILEFNSQDISKIQKSYPIWMPYTIKAGTYHGQNEDVKTIAQANLLIVNKNTPNNIVYLLTKTMYENLPFLNNVHKATKNMHIQKAIKGLLIPLHPGALKYYKEQKIIIPTHLIVN